MATNANGYPYPVPTDPVANGADAIKALADAIPLPIIKPQAVSGITVDATTGIATFSAQSAITLRFMLAGYNNYRIKLHLTAASGNADMTLQMVDTAGNANAEALYYYTVVDSNGGTVASSKGGPVNSVVVANFNTAGGQAIIELSSLAGQANQQAYVQARSFQAAGTYLRLAGGYREPKSGTTWQGVRLALSAGTMTGRASIYAER